MLKKETILLLDGNALLHRAWHAIPPLTTKSGLVVNAAYGFAVVLEKMLEQEKPDYMAVAWDLPTPTFRHELYKEYKAHREEKAQELYDQIDIIKEILSAYGIPSYSTTGFEADDVIATLAKKAQKKGMKARIVSGDLDLLQLVDDGIEVLFFKKGISQTQLYDLKAVEERFALTPSELIDFKALRGDPSDNIPGVAGIGEKGATELIQTHGSIKNLIQALKNDEVPDKYAKKLKGQEKTMEESRKLVELVHNIPVDFIFSQAKISEPDKQKLVTLFKDLEFRTLLRKYINDTPAPPIANNQARVQVEGTLAFCVLEQPADLFGATLCAIAISDGKDTTIIANPNKKQIEEIKEKIRKAEQIVVHDLKSLIYSIGVTPDSRFFDLMVASYLLHSGSRNHDIPSLAKELLDKRLPDFPKSISTEKEKQALEQVISSMPVLAQSAQKELEANGMKKIMEEIEMPLIHVLQEMEHNGIEIDVDSLGTFSEELKTQIEKLEKEIVEFAGEQFNVNSTQQLAQVLFEKLELPTKGIKKTKTGISTAAPELEKLMEAHPIIPLISEYRELAKLQSTYVEALPKLVGKDGRVHTSFNQTVTATGRLSSSDPNLQNIPIKTELGRKIRKAFVAGKGKVLVCADYSQIELRLVAVLAKDQAFIKAFKEGADIHTRTASEVFGVEEDKVTKEQRRAAKAINFGIIYGMGPRALGRATDMSMSEAKEFIDKYFQIHHAVRDYLDGTKIKAHDEGFVQTLLGRRRYFPEINSGVQMLVAQAERMAINMPVQGTAADIMKMAMISVQGWLEHSDWPAKLLLQVHDELVLEVNKDAVDGVARGVQELMQSVVSLEVPLVVDVEVGKNWGDLHDWQEK
ncbi:MAG: DNA polymerase I [Patescibacteria group bacterium]